MRFAKYSREIWCALLPQGRHRGLRPLVHGRPIIISAPATCPSSRSASATPISRTPPTGSSSSRLRDLGYRCFKLIHQETLVSLSVPRNSSQWLDGWGRRLQTVPYNRTRWADRLSRRLLQRQRLARQLNWQFPVASSGPWGEDTPSRWLTYDKAARAYRHYRDLHFSCPTSAPTRSGAIGTQRPESSASSVTSPLQLSESAMSARQFRRLIRNVVRGSGRQAGESVESKILRTNKGRVCIVPFERFGLNCDGSVELCCSALMRGEVIAGNAFTQDFWEIWKFSRCQRHPKIGHGRNLLSLHGEMSAVGVREATVSQRRSGSLSQSHRK